MAKRCTKPFATITNGVPRVVASGDIVADDDPVVGGRESAFEDVAAAVARSVAHVEQATAAPGKRRTRRTRKD